ncbi:MAG: MarR family transcriptional regulator [Gemmatimonadota bacterium]|nr:MarR family transcriptional regulator [Gemmatimonadota bacterium]MDH4351777.1 MarR family transcriptional regulator [Gemmatimonadota bacterium]MDH5196006.1 MarR family transcriptional regulator [Gemmatimonadota bacterium]
MTRRASAIQQEIRQTRPFQSIGQEAVVALFRTADLVRRYYGEVVEREGVTLQQYNVLRILRGAGPSGLPTLEVAERMVQRAPGITRMIDRLEVRGWVHRRRTSADRRQIHCVITAEGLALMKRLDEPVDAADHTAVRGLAKRDQQRLIGLLDAVRAAHADRDS